MEGTVRIGLETPTSAIFRIAAWLPATEIDLVASSFGDILKTWLNFPVMRLHLLLIL